MELKCILQKAYGLYYNNRAITPIPTLRFNFMLMFKEQKYNFEVDINIFDDNFTIDRTCCDYNVFESVFLSSTNRSESSYNTMYNWLISIFKKTKKYLFSANTDIWESNKIEV